MKVEIAKQEIESRIFTIRGMQVMLDRDLAYLYQVTTKVLNQAVKRNILRFPEDFMFQLSTIEKIELVTNCDRLEKLKHSTALPFVFTEHGVAMLSSVLRSEAAIEINISIMRTFVWCNCNYLYPNPFISATIGHNKTQFSIPSNNN